jgi:uroporphyrinogen-III synthase
MTRMRPLEGRIVALLESRMSGEIADMVRRLGGEPVSAPAVREIPRLEEVADQVRRLAAGEYQVVVFLTGVGGTTLFREADKLGLLPQVLQSVQAMTVACRGPKPLAAMKRFGIAANVVTVKPHTSHELLTALDAVSLRDAPTLLVHYGERNAAVADALRARGARLDEACSYEWALPEDPQPLAALVRDALEQRLDAMLFTSQVQCRHLFQVAREMRLGHELAASINRTVVVGAVGPVCAAALTELGVTTDVMPASPNMASLITAIGDYFALTGTEG